MDKKDRRAYTKSDLCVSKWIGINEWGRLYKGMSPEGTIYLKHSCDEWVIGGPDDAKRLSLDLIEAIVEAKEILEGPRQDPLLRRAEENGWYYYCKDCDYGVEGAGNYHLMQKHMKEAHA
jgi:hypothetical protein